MNFSLSTAFTESHKFWIVVLSLSFVSMNIFTSFFIYSLISWLFRSMLFSLHEVKWRSEVAQSCPTLCDPMDCSLSGSLVYGIFQARVLEWDATFVCVFIVFSPCSWHLILPHCDQKRCLKWFQFFKKFTKARFMAQNVIYLGEGSMCTWEKDEICCFRGEMPCNYQLGPMHHLKSVFPF